MKKLLLIINPRAGQMKANKKIIEILSIFSKGGYDCTAYVTEGQNDARDTCARRAGEFDLIVCIGGDGTLNEVISGVLLSKVKTSVGYIPAGSTNDFASSLKLSKDVIKAAEDIVNGSAHDIDVCSFNGRIYIYIASFGAFTMASYKTSQSNKNMLGHMAYILEGIKEIPSISPIHARVEVDGGCFEDDYVFGAITNSTSVGGVLTLDSSLVDMSDGLFEIILIKSPKTPIELSQIVTALRTSKLNSCESITFCSSANARLIFNEEISWTLDGEYQKGKMDNDVKILKHAVSFVLK